jgi:heterodisulfide reductase subunit A
MNKEGSIEIPRIGVFICHCGINIGGVINVPKVVEYAKTLSGVVYAEGNLYTCSSDGIRNIKEAIKMHKLDKVVVASCTPRTHEHLFRETCEEAGLNKYLFQMANIREHCSWVHMKDSEGSTFKAMDIVRMAVAKASLLKPGEESEVEVKPSTLIIGAGISGMQAALCLANQNFKVFIVEKEVTVGGILKNIYKLYPTNVDAHDYLNSIIQMVKDHANINLYTSTMIEEIKGYIGNFEVKALKDGKDEVIFNIGTIIVATGAEEYKPKGMYYYGDNSNVLTQLELEKHLQNGLHDKVKKVVMIQCVGAMTEGGEREYCSRICCTVALKNALLIKKLKPKSEIYILYLQLQSYGEYEKYYLRAQEQNIKFIKYLPEKIPRVTIDQRNRLTVNVYNAFLDKEMKLDCDLLVLSTPLIQHDAGRSVSSLLKVPLGSDGFFLESHIKLKPVDFATDGIYLCGTAHGPKTVEESIAQAYAAASSATIPMALGHVRSEAITAIVDENHCRGCAKCKDACEYNAITMQEDVLEVEPFISTLIQFAKINEVMCKGCGSCAVICPTTAISMKHFSNEQILAEIKTSYRGKKK